MNDFADWLSPILVKELRQGLRSRVFVSVLIVLQIAMVFATMAVLNDTSGGRDGGTAISWFLIGVTLLIVIPGAGLGAIQSEMKAKTMDLVLLTRLSPWRVVFGKWLALVLQSLLLVCTVLPFFVIRYFVGGFDLVNEGTALAWLLYGGMIATAFTIGCSAYQTSAMTRAGTMIGGVIVLFNVVPFLLLGSRFFMTGSPSASMLFRGWNMVGAIVFGIMGILYFFEMGAARIAPPGVNYAARKRLIILALIGSGLLIGLLTDLLIVYLIISLIFAAPIVIGGLVEPFHRLPSLYQPVAQLQRVPVLERLLAPVLMPGWGSGFLFSLIVTGVVWMTFSILEGGLGGKNLFLMTAFTGTVYFPLLLMHFFFRKKGFTGIGPLVGYWGFVIACFFIALLGINSPFGSGMAPPVLFSLIPPVSFFAAAMSWDDIFASNSNGALMVLMAVTGATLLILFIRAISNWREWAQMRQDNTKGQ